jgi:glycogen operon protein
VEGPSDDPQVETLRSRQIRNLFALTLLSVGTPLLLMGDEVRRTQGGNNNPYCQDNPISWFDWDLCRKNADLMRFVKLAIRLRNRLVASPRGPVTLAEFFEGARVDWYGTEFGPPDLSESSHSLAAIVYAASGEALNLILNAYWEPLRFTLPPSHLVGASVWRRVLDTALESPNDILEDVSNLPVEDSYLVQPRSIVLLANRQTIFAPIG